MLGSGRWRKVDRAVVVASRDTKLHYTTLHYTTLHLLYTVSVLSDRTCVVSATDRRVGAGVQ